MASQKSHSRNEAEARDCLCFILVVNFERLCGSALSQIFDTSGTFKKQARCCNGSQEDFVGLVYTAKRRKSFG